MVPILLIDLLLAGCVPCSVRSDGVPTADAPFTLTALHVGRRTFLFRGLSVAACRAVGPNMGLIALVSQLNHCGAPRNARARQQP
jgi:hypothetical protein